MPFSIRCEVTFYEQKKKIEKQQYDVKRVISIGSLVKDENV